MPFLSAPVVAHMDQNGGIMDASKSIILKGSRPSSKPQHCHVLELGPWRCHLKSPSLNLLVSEKSIFIPILSSSRLDTASQVVHCTTLHPVTYTVNGTPGFVQHSSPAPEWSTGERSHTQSQTKLGSNQLCHSGCAILSQFPYLEMGTKAICNDKVVLRMKWINTCKALSRHVISAQEIGYCCYYFHMSLYPF